MSSTPTPNLRLELQAAGENDDQWGDKLNTVIQLVENALTKRTTLSLTNADVTLSTTNYADDQSRNLVLALSGTLTGNVSIIVPALSHFYLVENLCTGAFTVTVKVAAQTGVVAAQGKTTIMYCNGTDVIAPVSSGSDASSLGGLLPAAFAQLAQLNQFTKGSGHTFTTIADAGTVTADCSLADRFVVTLAGNRTLALTNPHDGQNIQIWVKQDSTGGRSLSYPSNVKFRNGVAPALSSIASGLDVLTLTYNLADDVWVLDTLLGLAGGAVVGLVLSANEQNVRLFERAGSPSGAVTLNVTVNAGVLFSSTSTATAALDLTGFASGSTINLVNNGVIHGMGGDGGSGGAAGFQSSSSDNATTNAGTNGRAGGPAIKGPGAGRTFNITNANGRIWGGGGGGGGGGATTTGTSDGNGGGGGGGAGGGRGGYPGSSALTGAGNGSDGSSGGVGLNGTQGAGGASGHVGAGAGGSGGDGGSFGTAGSAGVTGSSPNGTGGAAGKAIDLNGGSATFLSGSGSPNVLGAVS